MGLIDLADQFHDVLSQLVSAPCRGTVNVFGTAGTVLSRGLEGSLPDGRRVRVVEGTRLYTGRPVRVRLKELQPTRPAGNFRPVNAGSIVTWASPPAGLSATGSVASPFAPDQHATIECSFSSDADDIKDGGDLMARSNAQGSCGIVLLSPDVRARVMDVSGDVRMTAAWKVRVVTSSLANNPIRTTQKRRIFDALTTILQRAVIGDETARIQSWTRAKADGIDAWDLEVHTIFTPDDDRFPVVPPEFNEMDATIDATSGAAPVLTQFTL